MGSTSSLGGDGQQFLREAHLFSPQTTCSGRMRRGRPLLGRKPQSTRGFRVCSVRGPSAPAVLLLLLPSPPPLAFSSCQSNLQQPRKSHSYPKIPSGAHSPPARVALAIPRTCLCLGCSSSTRKRQERETWTTEKAVEDSYLHLHCALKI